MGAKEGGFAVIILELNRALAGATLAGDGNPRSGDPSVRTSISATTLSRAESAPAAAGGMPDRFGRLINYVRISLTDKCNLRCVYCMPEDMRFRPSARLMQDDEVVRLIRVLGGLGVNKIRYTGGEPTLRAGLVCFVETASGQGGIETQALTTNGLLMPRLAGPLRDAGLTRVNISLDTVDADRYRRMTRWGDLDQVWQGIRAAEDRGFEVKINCVVVRGWNDGRDVVEMARLTLDHPWQVRFIEMMPFGGLHQFQREHVVSERELRQTIAEELGELSLQNGGLLDGEARVYRLADAPGTLGFISSVTQPFCAGCNRARVTADGMLRLCLLRDREVNMLAPMREGVDDVELEALIRRGVWNKPWGHGLNDAQFATNRTMSEIGG